MKLRHCLLATVGAAAASLVLSVEGRAAICPPSPAPDARDVVPLKFTGQNTFSVPVTLGEGPASKTLDMTVDTGAAVSGVPAGVADALIAAKQAVELQKQTATLFTGDKNTFRTIRIKTIRVGCHIVPDVIAMVINAQVIGLPVLRHSGRFTIDAYHQQLIFNDDPIHPPSPSAASSDARASMLIASAGDPQKPVVNLGSTVWSTIPPTPGQPASVAVKADADIPDLKMHATMTLRKNTDPTLQATHTIDLKFSFAEGAPITGFKDVGAPQMRMLDSPASEELTSVKIKISDVYFFIALAKGEQYRFRNLALMQTRGWFDFPLLLNDNRIAKIVFQKSPEGEAMLAKAFEAWK